MRGTICYSLVIPTYYLFSPVLNLCNPARLCPAALHYGCHQKVGFAVVFFPWFFLFTVFLVLWALKTQKQIIFFLFAIAFHILENRYAVSPWFSLLEGIQPQFFQSLLCVALLWMPTDKSISFLKENHCIFTQDHFMHFCSLHCLYSLIRYLPFSQQRDTVDSRSACRAGIAVLPLHWPTGYWLTRLNLTSEVSTDISRRLQALDLWQCFLRGLVLNSTSYRRKSNFSHTEKEEKRELGKIRQIDKQSPDNSWFSSQINFFPSGLIPVKLKQLL